MQPGRDQGIFLRPRKVPREIATLAMTLEGPSVTLGF